MNPLCCIFNYNENENANSLYVEFSKHVETFVLDSDSLNPYPYFINVSNLYYTNLFNHAIRMFKNGEYSHLCIITSDVVMNPESILYVCNKMKHWSNSIGVYQLQADKHSKDWHNPWTNIPFQQVAKYKFYETPMVEGFFNIIHGDIVNLMEEIPLDVNKFGVCITKYYCEISKLLKKKIIIDTKYTIFHPDKKGYDYNESHSYEQKFFVWMNEQLKQVNNTGKFRILDAHFNWLVDKSHSRLQILDKVSQHFNKDNIICAEIGVFRGDFSKKIQEYLNPKHLFLIDIWEPYDDNTQLCKQSEEYFNYIYNEVKETFKDKTKYTVLKMTSVDASKIIEDNSIDFIYIDANHIDVATDLKCWFPKLKEGGIIAGHDYGGKVKEDVDKFCGESVQIINSEVKQWIYIKTN